MGGCFDNRTGTFFRIGGFKDTGTDKDTFLKAEVPDGAFVMLQKDHERPPWLSQGIGMTDSQYFDMAKKRANELGGRLVFRAYAKNSLGICGARARPAETAASHWIVQNAPSFWDETLITRWIQERGFINVSIECRKSGTSWSFNLRGYYRFDNQSEVYLA